MCCQNRERHFAWLKQLNEKTALQSVVDVKSAADLKALHVAILCPANAKNTQGLYWYVEVCDQIWSPARGTSKQLFLQNDIHEKQWKTELHLIRVMMTLKAEQSN